MYVCACRDRQCILNLSLFFSLLSIFFPFFNNLFIILYYTDFNKFLFLIHIFIFILCFIFVTSVVLGMKVPGPQLLLLLLGELFHAVVCTTGNVLSLVVCFLCFYAE